MHNMRYYNIGFEVSSLITMLFCSFLPVGNTTEKVLVNALCTMTSLILDLVQYLKKNLITLTSWFTVGVLSYRN